MDRKGEIEQKYLGCNPKISVIMGIYNCEDTLGKAIDSIIAQSYTNWKLIMCDDGSTDDTYQVALKYAAQYPTKITLLRNEHNKKLSYTLNRCLEAASSPLIARMDGDDISHKDRFQKQVQFLLNHPEIDLVGTSMQCFDEFGLHAVRHAIPEPDKWTLRQIEPFYHPTLMTYNRVYKDLGGYLDIDRTERVEDLDLYFRFYNKGFNGANLDEVLYYVREDNRTLKRRIAKYRFNGILTRVYGYKLLGYPRAWLIRPVITAIIKSMVPVSVVKQIRRIRGQSG